MKRVSAVGLRPEVNGLESGILVRETRIPDSWRTSGFGKREFGQREFVSLQTMHGFRFNPCRHPQFRTRTLPREIL